MTPIKMKNDRLTILESAQILHSNGYKAVRFKASLPNDLDFFSDFTRVASLSVLAKEIYKKGISGCTAELGVYRGFFSKLISTYFPDRKLFLFDTFEGFPENQANFDKHHFNASGADYDFTNTSVEIIQNVLGKFLNYEIRKGFFPGSADGITDKFCFVSLDVDLYEPTLAGLKFFYPKLSAGGYIIVHDFGHPSYPGCGIAVRE